MRFWALAIVLSLVALGVNVKGEREYYDDISSIISESMFNEMLMHHNYDNDECPGKGFYTYRAFIAAAKTFNGFGSTGDHYTRKREIAAFLAQTSHQTTGYCFNEYISKPGNYCIPSEQWSCVPGKEYHERGPFQLSNNYNYGQAGDALGVDLLTNPDLVATNPVMSFKTALWFWMTPQQPKPSCHDAITGQWTPSEADKKAGRVPGYGLCTNIINGDRECGKGSITLEEQSRIRFYKQYCDILEVSYGDNLDCSYQKHYEYLQLKLNVDCGKDAGGKVCANGACCSQWGYCGYTDLHCKAGCQSNCNFYNCGPKANGTLCPEGQCCTKDGYCGAAPEDCVSNCQNQCTPMRCGAQGNGKRCPFFLCCGPTGYCGYTQSECGLGCQSQCDLPLCGRQAGGALCPGNRCCNRYGYCHVSVPCGPGCQTKCDLITLSDHLIK